MTQLFWSRFGIQTGPQIRGSDANAAKSRHQRPLSIQLLMQVCSLAVALVILVGCGKESSPRATTDSPPPSAVAPAAAQNLPLPQALANIGEYGENIYDAAQAKNWTDARAKLDQLKGAIQQYSTELNKAVEQRTELQRLVDLLDKSITRKAQFETTRDANQVTLMGSELSASYRPKVPVEVNRLDYDGRELEIWSHAHNMAKLKDTAAHIRRTWDEVKPQIESHNGTAESQTFSKLVTDVEQATTVAQYQKLAPKILEQVDQLEKVF